ncbi:MAG: glycerol kinase GlpK [Bdellovibrionaceae bacterium]|nr:glycerol kinase GlpK [Pseudobdellovibrionaceae bacterium]
MAIDQGTTGSQVLLVDHAGQIVAAESQDFPQQFPKAGWVEHDLEEIWRSIETAADRMFKAHPNARNEIAAIGITNQRETVVFWDQKTGRALHNAIVWQDRRTSDLCEKLKKKGLKPKIKSKTGLVIDPYFSATKMQWLLENVAGLKEKAASGAALAGTMDSFVLWRLTQGASHKTDVSNASRTMLMNIKTGAWDNDLLKLFKVPAACLPEIADSSGVFGHTKGVGFLPDGIPVAGIAGDQQSALFGQACFKAGEAKCTFGTGSFLLMNTGAQMKSSKAGLLTTVAWRLPGQKMQYALEGGAFVCGAAVQWLRDGLGLIKTSAEVEALANEVNDTLGVQFVPALTGLGAPYWWPEARGLITGLTRGTTKAHLARATLESMAMQNVEILLAMQKDLGRKLPSLKVDGGATANGTLMQMQADMLGVTVERPQNIETTAMGAVFLAGLGTGFWKNLEELRKVWKIDRDFKVKWSAKQRSVRLKEWQAAVTRAKA